MKLDKYLGDRPVVRGHEVQGQVLGSGHQKPTKSQFTVGSSGSPHAWFCPKGIFHCWVLLVAHGEDSSLWPNFCPSPMPNPDTQPVLCVSSLLTSSWGSGAVTLLSSGTAEMWSWRPWLYKRKSSACEKWLNLPSLQLRRVLCALHSLYKGHRQCKGPTHNVFHYGLKMSGRALLSTSFTDQETKIQQWNDLLGQETRSLDPRVISMIRYCVICVTCIFMYIYVAVCEGINIGLKTTTYHF